MHRTKGVSEVAAEVQVRAPKKKEETRLASVGSTLLNCAMSDNYRGGAALGKMVNIIGESSAGKTFLAETMLAEAANNPQFDEYRLILDDSEHAHEIDTNYLFGEKAAERIKAPKYDSEGDPVYSDTVEQFFANVNRILDEGTPTIYCLDSLDTLTDNAELERADEYVKVDEGKQKEISGTYGMAKAKLLSQLFRTVKKKLADTNSILLIISQTRDNIAAFGAGAPKKVRSGGKALEFYCTHVIWLSSIKSITDSASKIKLGNMVEAKVSKNKLTGKVRTVTFPLLYSYGIDDIESCIDFLVDMKYIGKSGAFLNFPGLDKPIYKKDLVTYVEKNDMVDEIRAKVGELWAKRENDLIPARRPRFA